MPHRTSTLACVVLLGLAALAAVRPALAETIDAFFGRYEGRTLAGGDGETTIRDLDVAIEPAGDTSAGRFRITWSTVVRRAEAAPKRKSYSILFKRTPRPGIFASAMRTDMFGNTVPLDPLKGDPFVWCRIIDRTLTVYALQITEDGGYDLQVYDRTLRDGGLDLKFTRLGEGRPATVVTAVLERVSG